MGISTLIFSGPRGLQITASESKRIDIWWRGRKNGDLMALIVYLLTENREWENAEIRVLRVVENEAGKEPARAALQNLINFARIDATAEILVSNEPFQNIIPDHSEDALCTFIGFEVPDREDERAWYNNYSKIISEMPSVILVNSQEKERLPT